MKEFMYLCSIVWVVTLVRETGDNQNIVNCLDSESNGCAIQY